MRPVEAVSAVPVDLVAHGLRVTGRAVVPVTGSSMLPTITPGERVVLHPVPPAGVHPGEVVAVRHRNGLILHRVLDRFGDRLITAGDNLSLADPPVPLTQVVGVARGVPARPAARPWSPVAGVGPVEVWMVTDGDSTSHCGRPESGITPEPVALPAAWRVRLRPRHGIGVSPAVLGELRAAVSGSPCLGISEYAVSGAADVLTGPLPAGTRILVGCTFGRVDVDLPGLLLPPELANAHVRCGPPGVRLDPGAALARLLDVLGRPGAEDRT
ncbi:S26 family signal peptidase [Micromonospora wenchangensis]|uniref:S26 family signal peptidase n=1 Tax=Micromonospora wenchangensis TaxID=1185415 RepID=UPI001303FE47|nr:S26 family signal peptidase [Micromonospora wenchangensis]